MNKYALSMKAALWAKNSDHQEIKSTSLHEAVIKYIGTRPYALNEIPKAKTAEHHAIYQAKHHETGVEAQISVRNLNYKPSR